MNCDDFLEALVSTDAKQCTAAHAHANDCPACAELAEIHALLKSELGAPEPLPQRLKGVWESAASESSHISLTRRASEGGPSQIPLALVSLAAALMLLISVFFLTGQRPDRVAEKPNGIVAPNPLTSVTEVRSIDASAELDDLLAHVNALEVELKAAASRAQLLDARREANVLLATYNNW
jgi:hypothetical protein